MKKTVSVLLALVLCLSIASACAEFSFDVLSFMPAQQVVSGTTYTYSIPEDWQAVDISSEEKSAGVIASWSSVNGEVSMTVSVEASTEEITLDALQEMLSSWSGYEEIVSMTINGQAFLGYEQPAQKSVGLLTLLPEVDSQTFLHFDFKFMFPDEAAATLGTQIAGTLTAAAQREE